MAKTNKAKLRQMALMLGAGALLVGVIMLGLMVAESEKPVAVAPPKVQGTQLKAPGGQIEKGEVSQSITDAKFADLQELIERNAKEAKEREDRVKSEAAAKERDAKNKSATATDAADGKDGEPIKLFDASKLGQDAPRSARTDNGNRASPSAASNAPPAAPALQERRLTTLELGGRETSASNSQPGLVNPQGAMSDYARVGEALRGAGAGVSTSAPAPVTRTTENYVPSGTFFKVAVVNGMDAPTGGQAQNNPHPALLQVISFGNLPNKFKTDVKYCHVTSQGWGDVSAERAYLRTEFLSCVRPNGDVIDVPIQGYIVGADGKTGLRGRVVSKQGQILANALWTSSLASFGEVAKAASTSVNIYAGGTAATSGGQLSNSDLLKRGALGGLGDAAKQLSNYYIQLAEKVWPVIEIDGGQTADVVLSQGVSLLQHQPQQASGLPDLNGIGSTLKNLSNNNFMQKR